MDFMSLPNEMVDSVLKYVSITNMVKLRRLNIRVDRIARRAGLNRFDVNNFEVSGSRKVRDSWVIRIVLNKKQRLNSGLTKNEVITHNCKGYVNLHKAMEKRLRSIKVKQVLSLWKVNFSDIIVAILKRNKEAMRNCKRVDFHNLEFRHSASTSLFSIFPAVTFIEIDDTSGTKKLFNAETISNFSTNALHIDLGSLSTLQTAKMLNDDFLNNVVKNCIKFAMTQSMPTFFSIGKKIALLQGIPLNLDVERYWYLGSIDNDDVEIQETINEVHELKFELPTKRRQTYIIRTGPQSNTTVVEFMSNNSR